MDYFNKFIYIARQNAMHSSPVPQSTRRRRRPRPSRLRPPPMVFAPLPSDRRRVQTHSLQYASSPNATHVGFDEVAEQIIRVPLNSWPKDKHEHDIGQWCLLGLDPSTSTTNTTSQPVRTTNQATNATSLLTRTISALARATTARLVSLARMIF